MKPSPTECARVLVVDDNAFVRRVITERLRRSGCDVREARDGAEGLAVFQKDPVEVVITDLNMPALNGLGLLAALRNQLSPPEVILLTGTHAGDAAAAVQALRLGAHDFIAKDATASDAVVLAVQRAFDKWRLRDENARLLRELRRQSLTDGLTGVWNRRAFDKALEQEIARSRRSETELSLVLLDIDHFKKVNDEWGHAAGDAVLVAFAGRLQALSRGSDRLFRYGGEEFALLLGDTDSAGALTLARRAVQVVAGEKMPAGRGAIALTCSAGAASLRPTDDEAGGGLVARADAALYAAKGSGRNRAVAETPRPAVPDSAAPPSWPLALLEDRC